MTEKLKSWPFRKTKQEDVAQRQLMKISDLPLYPDSSEDLSSYRFVEDDPLLLQNFVSTYRVVVQDSYVAFMEKFSTVQKGVNTAQDITKKTYDYIRHEGTVVPKAVAITLGGMAGFLFGMKRGGAITRAFYSGSGIVVAAAFCYPHETVDFVRTGGIHARDKIFTSWSHFSAPPPPPASSKEAPKLVPPVQQSSSSDEMKDKDMYTTRT